MHIDPFIEYIFTFSDRRLSTQKIYKKWLIKCCAFAGKPHPLDLCPADITAFLLMLDRDRHLSPASLIQVHYALVYVFGELLVSEVPKGCRVSPEFQDAFILPNITPKQDFRLPTFYQQREIQTVFSCLPASSAGVALRMIYDTLLPVDVLLTLHQDALSLREMTITVNALTITLNGSSEYAERQYYRGKAEGHSLLFEGRTPGKPITRSYLSQTICTARHKAGVLCGLGVSGLRQSGIIHQIQQRDSDLDLKRIQKQCRLSYPQFRRYVLAVSGLRCRVS